MSTNEILEILKCHDEYDSYADSDGYCEEMLETYEEKRKEIIQQIQTLTSVQHRLDQRIKQMRVRQSLMSTVSGSAGPTSKSTF
ncbi:hypothetical protein GCM10010911_41330 [Paenibacillus nasutitermitis]|uniref:Uncharacterized protein n=2 Tax=Paenibacillus nasutitermitis TaxID=1652958 RepID=A0A916Z7K1_9BACL|nr:hypothetical protein GCM10010911_41330 [Paenibacillus nasutitermitis]